MMDDMVDIIEEICGEIRANGGKYPDWMLRINESFKNDRNPPGRNKNSVSD
jgi:hypothetical protein